METALKGVEFIETLLRDAFGVADDFVLSDREIEILRSAFSRILPYFIVFTARSGSTFLLYELENTLTLSRPYEWFNYDDVASLVEKQKMTFVEYMLLIVSENRSEDGIFGSEINWLQLVALNAIVPVQKIFPKRIRWFFLRRRNSVAQGISHFIAAKSQIYHAYQLRESASEAINAVAYNAEGIKKHVTEILRQEAKIEDWLKSMHVAPVNIYYEDIVENPKRSSMLFANVMNIWLPKEYLQQTDANPMKKIGTDRNSEFEQRFRSDEVDFLRDALDQRPLVLLPAKSI